MGSGRRNHRCHHSFTGKHYHLHGYLHTCRMYGHCNARDHGKSDPYGYFHLANYLCRVQCNDHRNAICGRRNIRMGTGRSDYRFHYCEPGSHHYLYRYIYPCGMQQHWNRHCYRKSGTNHHG